MSAEVSSSDANVGNAVGKIKIRAVKSEVDGDDFYRCTWDLKGRSRKECKSPVFTIPNREECKWYLSIHSIEDIFDKGSAFFSTRLHLHDESACKAAVAEFAIQLEKYDIKMTESCKSRTFKFIKKSENSAAILTVVSTRELRSYASRKYKMKVLCKIMVKNAIPEDDSFPNDFGSLLKNNLFTDVVLSVGRKKYRAHKVILASRSSVFAAMFAHDMVESKGDVKIKDIRKEVMEEMLHYIYTGEVKKLDENLVQDLLIAADKYDLSGLRKKCEEVLIESLSSSNAFDLLLFAESYNASKLRFEAIYLIRREKTKLMKTPGWESLNKSNPALVREIAEDLAKPESNSDTEDESDSDAEDESGSDTETESDEFDSD